MATEQDIQILKQFTSTLDANQKEEFRTRFNGLNAEQKDSVIQNIVQKYPQQSQQSQSPMSEAITMGASGLTGAGAGLKAGDVDAMVTGTANSLLANQPSTALRYPEQAAMAGMPGMNIASGTEMKSAGPSGVVGAIESLTHALRGGKPDSQTFTPQTDITLPKPETLSGAVAGKALEVGAPILVANILSSFPKSGKVKPGLTPEYAQKVRGDMYAMREELGKELSNKVTELSKANPDKTIDLSDQLMTLKFGIADKENNPGLAGDIARTIRKIKNPEVASKLQALIDDPSAAKKLSLRDAEDIKQAISQGVKFQDRTPGDLEMKDLLDEIKLAQAEQFPELKSVRKPYADYMDAYRNVKGKFKPNQLLGKIEGNFGNAEIEQMARKVLPPETLKEIDSIRGKVARKEMIGQLLKAGGITATGSGIVGGGIALGKKLSGKE